jgi:hypothetical protein
VARSLDIPRSVARTIPLLAIAERPGGRADCCSAPFLARRLRCAVEPHNTVGSRARNNHQRRLRPVCGAKQNQGDRAEGGAAASRRVHCVSIAWPAGVPSSDCRDFLRHRASVTACDLPLLAAGVRSRSGIKCPCLPRVGWRTGLGTVPLRTVPLIAQLLELPQRCRHTAGRGNKSK